MKEAFLPDWEIQGPPEKCVRIRTGKKAGDVFFSQARVFIRFRESLSVYVLAEWFENNAHGTFDIQRMATKPDIIYFEEIDDAALFVLSFM